MNIMLGLSIMKITRYEILRGVATHGKVKESILKFVLRQSSAMFMLMLIVSFWSLSASAQVSSSFSASPTSFEAGAATSFTYSIVATAYPIFWIWHSSGAINP